MKSISDIKSLFPIVAEGIELHLFSKEDITPAYLGWLNDKQLMRFSNQQYRSHTLQSCEDYLATFTESENLFISIIETKTMATIGTMTAYNYSMHSTSDIGILLGANDFSGRGFGSLAWETLVDFLFNEAGVRKVFAGTLSCNVAMINIMEHSGMIEDGRFTDHELVNGYPCDVINYYKIN